MKEIGSNSGKPMEVHHLESVLGQVLVACTARGIRAVFLGDNREALSQRMREEFPFTELVMAGPETQQLTTAVVESIDAGGPVADVPLDPIGTEFQLRVWKALRDLPAGTTATYSEIAERIGRPRAVRAVASACAKNRVAINIPCHRAIRKDGKLGGYRWGMERKKQLLEMERARIEALEAGSLA